MQYHISSKAEIVVMVEVFVVSVPQVLRTKKDQQRAVERVKATVVHLFLLARDQVRMD
jgi:hypothetical protein